MSITTEEASRIIGEHQRRYLAKHAETRRRIRQLYTPSRIHSVTDLRHPDSQECYYCIQARNDQARAYFLRYGPHPHRTPRHA